MPMSLPQTIIGSLVAITGNIFIAFIFGNMAALMTSSNQKDSSA